MEVETEMQMEMGASANDDSSSPDHGDANSIFRQSQRPLSLKFKDVVYKIKTKGKIPQGQGGGSSNGGSTKPKTIERTILKGVSGVVFPGELLAMLGPSGSGKTTLLTALGGRLGGNLSGSITYNSRPFSASMKRKMGFVTQDDVLYPHLTVTETLVYTALLRLPNTLTRKEKAGQAEAVMTQLGLTACRDSIIGGPLIRGVSGGERKRVSIGQEMLINPSLIFLDEPTSGLDSTTAQRIVSTLWELARGGRTVVMTIHQPSSRLFYMFHKVLLMSDGSPVYFGKGSDAIGYFAGIGYAPDVAMNPSDFLLDLANGIGVGSDEPSLESRAEVKQALVSAYAEHIQPKLMEELKEDAEEESKRYGSREGKSDRKKEAAERWSTSWWDQFRVLLERDLKERRHEAFSGLKIAQVMVTAFLAGLLWWKSGSHTEDQVGLLYFATGFWGFFPLFQALFTFPQERTMLGKERSSGMYRLSSYFASRMVGDLPMDLVLPTLFVTIVYWMGGLKPDATHFFGTLFSILLSVLVASGLGLALGALVMNLKTATTLGSVIMLAFMLVGGFYVQKVPAFISWIRYISISYYTFKLGLVSQFSPDEIYECRPNVTCKVGDFPSVAVVGLSNGGMAIAVMFGMLVFYRLVAYLALMRVGVTR